MITALKYPLVIRFMYDGARCNLHCHTWEEFNIFVTQLMDTRQWGKEAYKHVVIEQGYEEVWP